MKSEKVDYLNRRCRRRNIKLKFMGWLVVMPQQSSENLLMNINCTVVIFNQNIRNFNAQPSTFQTTRYVKEL